MAKKQTLGLTVKKDDNISEWYTQAITKADLVDYTDVSGCIVFKPYGYEIWDTIKNETIRIRSKTNICQVWFEGSKKSWRNRKG